MTAEQDYADLARQAMAELLDTPDIERTDNLFAVGGDSMTAIQLAWRLAEVTGLEVNAADDIMREPTPLAIGRRLAERTAEPGAG
jgi:phthiocerol/phenolphthiocerol synthesis type-I polyketide synthase E